MAICLEHSGRIWVMDALVFVDSDAGGEKGWVSMCVAVRESTRQRECRLGVRLMTQVGCQSLEECKMYWKLVAQREEKLELVKQTILIEKRLGDVRADRLPFRNFDTHSIAFGFLLPLCSVVRIIVFAIALWIKRLESQS